jgi:hypothetical protein
LTLYTYTHTHTHTEWWGKRRERRKRKQEIKGKEEGKRSRISTKLSGYISYSASKFSLFLKDKEFRR